MESFAGEVKHHRAVLADRIQHDRPFALRESLSHDVNTLRLEDLEMGEWFALHAAARHSSITLWASSMRQIKMSGSHGFGWL